MENYPLVHPERILRILFCFRAKKYPQNHFDCFILSMDFEKKTISSPDKYIRHRRGQAQSLDAASFLSDFPLFDASIYSKKDIFLSFCSPLLRNFLPFAQ